MLLDQNFTETIISSAESKGADFVELYAEQVAGHEVGFDDNKLNTVSSSTRQGVGVRVAVGSQIGFAHVSDLSDKSIGYAVDKALESAKALKEFSSNNMKQASINYKNYNQRENELEDIEELSTKQDLVDKLEESNEIARSVDSRISNVQVSCLTSSKVKQIINNQGVNNSSNQQRTRFITQVTASSSGEVQNGMYAPGRTVGKQFFDLLPINDLATTAATSAVRLLDAQPAPSGQFPIVLAKGAGGVLFHEACGHGLEADHILRDPSAFANKVGQRVASENLTIIDDGTYMAANGVGDWGTLEIDDEGYSSNKHVLIENGILTDYMWDTLRANEQQNGKDFGGYINNLDSSFRIGNGRRQTYQHLPMVRMTNTYVDRGELDPEDIIADTKFGIYILDLSGGQVNTITGDFVFGMNGAYLIENGKLTTPLKPAQLIGNGPEVLKLIDAIGNDFDTWSGTCGKDGQSVPVSAGQPTLRVSNMIVGGTN